MAELPADKPDRSLTFEEKTRAARLTASQLERIDHCLLSHASPNWQKVARIIGQTMITVHDEFPSLPDGFYSSRIKLLVKSGALEAVGNLDHMRFSEVRLRR